MNPSTSRTNGRRLISQASTPVHDAIQLWLSETENQKEVARFAMGTMKRVRATLDDVKQEVPIFGYNNFLLGIVDCTMLVRYTVEEQLPKHAIYNCPTYPKCDHWKTETRNRNWNILIEIKPKLDAISSTIGQMKVYAKNRGPDKMILLTLSDQTQKFDKLLEQSGISVFRIPTQNIRQLLDTPDPYDPLEDADIKIDVEGENYYDEEQTEDTDGLPVRKCIVCEENVHLGDLVEHYKKEHPEFIKSSDNNTQEVKNK